MMTEVKSLYFNPSNLSEHNEKHSRCGRTVPHPSLNLSGPHMDEEYFDLSDFINVIVLGSKTVLYVLRNFKEFLSRLNNGGVHYELLMLC